MPQKDFIAPVKKIERNTVIEVTDLINSLQVMIKDRGYDTLVEQEHKEQTDTKGNKKVFFYWFAKKQVSTYVKLFLEISMKSSVTNISIEQDEKKKTMQDGDISFEIGGYVSKDIEDEWRMRKKSPFKKFLREAFDKFISRDKMESYESELEEDIKNIVHELKTYLKMQRID
ncbi:MAG: hypothetical protein U9Q69_00710 [Nanoarchaeota archaeon]|nr:hypothetical protein [Nanoarchaeota archaeon]